MAKPPKKPSPTLSASTLKALFGAGAAIKALRQDGLRLEPSEQFLALSLALVGLCAEFEMSPESAQELLKRQFDLNYSNAKTAAKKVSKEPTGGAS